MKRLRSVRRLGMLIFLCVSCVVIMKVLAFDNRDESFAKDKGEETIVGRMIDRIAVGEIDLSDEDSIRRAISEGEEEFGISLSEEHQVRIVEFMQTLDTIESDAGDYIEQAKQMYQKYSAEFIEEANDTIGGAIKSAAEGAVRNFIQSIIPDKSE